MSSPACLRTSIASEVFIILLGSMPPGGFGPRDAAPSKGAPAAAGIGGGKMRLELNEEAAVVTFPDIDVKGEGPAVVAEREGDSGDMLGTLKGRLSRRLPLLHATASPCDEPMVAALIGIR